MRHILLLSAVIYSMLGSAQQIVSSDFGSCLTKSMNADTLGCAQGTNYLLSNDTLKIYGLASLNCCTTPILHLEKTGSTVSVEKVDSGSPCKCNCEFCFRIYVRLADSDSGVLYNKALFKRYADTIADTNLTHTAHIINLCNLQFVPNPAGNETWIHFLQSYYEQAALTVISSSGQQVLTEQIILSGSEYRLKTGFAPGIYFISITLPQLRYSGKLVIQ